MESAEYVVEWTFPDAKTALEAWHREIPKAYKVVEGPSVSLVTMPGIGKPGYRVTGRYVVEG